MHDNPEMASQLVERETSGPREIGSGCSPTPVSGHRRSTAFGSMPSSVGSSDPARGLEEPSPASFHDSSLHPVHDLRGSPADTWRRPSEADHVELMHMFDAERRESVGLFAAQPQRARAPVLLTQEAIGGIKHPLQAAVQRFAKEGA